MKLTYTQIEVRWKPISLEEARGFITHYTVTAEPVGSQRGEFSVTVGPNITRLVMHGLSSALIYWITVSASTAVGTSTNNNRCLIKLSGIIAN